MSEAKKKFGSFVNVNALIWISSLHPEEQGVTIRILDDLGAYFQAINLNHFAHEPKTASEMLKLLDDIADGARFSGLRPIIHFDTHGGKESGLHIAASGENIPWEIILQKLRIINIGTQNNLCVVSLACFGFYLARSISILEATPFYIFAAPFDIVTAGYIESTILAFYDRVFGKNDIVGAYTEVLSEKLNFLHCEELFFTSMKGYVRDNCTGKGAKKRTEDHVSWASSVGLLNKSNISLIRKISKQKIKPTQALFQKYVDIFLIGKSVPFTMKDIRAQIDKERSSKK